ncbi:MAG: SIR2 family protein [Caldilineaceae bacterium]|nr:SIR2 family protein [Caldilineaceae bacterium]
MQIVSEATLSTSDLSLPLDAFVRSIKVRRNTPHSLFLGAGASVSSGVPSAEGCIWEWKRDIFLTNNSGLEEQFSELSLPSVRNRIQSWLDSQGMFPERDAKEEYGFYIQECFPIPDDRRAFFQEKIQSAKPHLGYLLLSHLAKADLVRSVWSTNFDRLAARAVQQENVTPIEIGLDSLGRLSRRVSKGELLCVSLHGDYRYDRLKNTTEELQEQESELTSALVSAIRENPVIVCGYSGRDDSIMEAFHTAYREGSTGTLYWCGYYEGDISDRVASLISFARGHGNEAYYVPSRGFDDLMTRIALHSLEDASLRESALQRISDLPTIDPLESQPFETRNYPTKSLIKSNAFEIDCPDEVLAFRLTTLPTRRPWEWLRDRIGNRPIAAVPYRGKVYALGLMEDIKDIFGAGIKGGIERTPVSPADLRIEDGAIVSLMRQAFVRSLASSYETPTDGRSELWLDQRPRKSRHDGREWRVYESVIVFLRRFDDRQFAVFKPSVRVLDETGEEAPPEVTRAIKQRELSSQYNDKFNDALEKWRRHLFSNSGSGVVEFHFPHSEDSSCRFRIRRSPIFAQIGQNRGGKSVAITESHRPLVRQDGFELPEPSLVFCNRYGTSLVNNTHPIRGVVENRPYDYPLTQKGLLPSIRIGVICPGPEAKALSSYLHGIRKNHIPSDSERDYLVDYPGFPQAYGLPVEIPEPGALGWTTLSEPSSDDQRNAARSIAHRITRAIDTFHSSYAPHVVLVFFPQRWERFRGYSDAHERFDVHDFVKAFAVQRGIATQFLVQKTLSDRQQCRIWWWLSLALYVKGMRTPWVLEGLDRDTAYVGLGYSVDRGAERGSHIVLGCSHIYSPQGEGLQYRLSKIENPIFRRKNPYMSEDDARRTGETIRQLFFDARMKLPSRVVLHKRTSFLKEERKGLLEGLSGVNAIDMVEIQVDHALRYVASITSQNGKSVIDGYPVRRGTVMKQEAFAALLWVHGATSAANNPNRRYYQGKRRIPAPLTIRRHMGSASLEQLSSEILGLSKMNWNSFDLYSKMPATLQSSGEIARIGSLLQRFGGSSYDYRLFI